MPAEAAIAEPPAQTTPTTPSVIDTMDTMLGDFDKSAGAPPDKEPKEPLKPAGKPTDDKAPPVDKTQKPPEKGTEKPPDKAPVSGPAQLRKRLEEIEKEYEGFKLTAKQEREKWEKEKSEYNKRPYLTKEQQERIEANEKRVKELESDLYAQDYGQSPEFAEKYKKKWQSAYKSAAQRASGVSVEWKDANDEVQTRRATEADFNKVRAAAPEEQLELAEKLFGKYAFVIMQDINGLKSIEDAANEDIATRSKTYHETKRQMAERMEQEAKAGYAAGEDVDRQLVEKYPEFFGDDPANPEGTTAMNKALEMIDNILSESSRLPIAEKAAKAVLVRRWAASFPRLVISNRKKDEIIKSKDEELAKYRKSDPGSGGDSAPAVKPSDDGELDVANMAKAFDG